VSGIPRLQVPHGSGKPRSKMVRTVLNHSRSGNTGLAWAPGEAAALSKLAPLASGQRGILQMPTRAVVVLTLALGVLTGVALAADPPNLEPSVVDRTPPRLSFVDGQVSFWRPGAQDWTQAQANTPLAPGDELATAALGNLEVQIGARSFVRAWA